MFQEHHTLNNIILTLAFRKLDVFYVLGMLEINVTRMLNFKSKLS